MPGKLDKFMIALLAVAIVVSVSATFLNISRINRFAGLTGYGTAGFVNITINTTYEVNITAIDCNFGSGYITPPYSTATLESNGTKTQWTGAGTTSNLTVRNDGNVNISLNISSGKTLATFYGVDCSGSGCEYKFWTANKEDNSCRTATGGGDGNIAHSGTSMDTTQQTGCPHLQFGNGKDEIFVMCRLVLHETVPPGSKTDTWTFYAVEHTMP